VGAITEALYERLAGDVTLAGLLATYGGAPAVFSTDPPPGDATLPYVVAAGQVSQEAYDTKTTRGLTVRRDVRCYAKADGSVETIEAIAEQVWALLHRYALAIAGYDTWVVECTGPIRADDDDAYGRVITARMVIVETVEEGS